MKYLYKWYLLWRKTHAEGIILWYKIYKVHSVSLIRDICISWMSFRYMYAVWILPRLFVVACLKESHGFFFLLFFFIAFFIWPAIVCCRVLLLISIIWPLIKRNITLSNVELVQIMLCGLLNWTVYYYTV